MLSDMMALPTIAYFSLEIAHESHIPTHSGGLGVLAGDTLRSAADLGLPMVGVTLLHRKGYFFQRLDEEGHQSEEPVAWPIDDFLQPTDGVCQVEIEGWQVTVRAWHYTISGVSGAEVPVFALDTDVPGNDRSDRTLTDYLYGGDERYRFCQEVIFGVGGRAHASGAGVHSCRQVPWRAKERGWASSTPPPPLLALWVRRWEGGRRSIGGIRPPWAWQ
ncbi:MAG: glycogen/starch/alpha-glucan phosphorylase [Candidatus Entotheonellia bacterium]